MNRDQLLRELRAAGVTGLEDFGHFVNDTRYLEPSTFDSRAAAPILLRCLPELTSRRDIESAVGHLSQIKGAAPYAAYRAAFEKWAKRDSSVGWVIGGALARAARAQDVDDLLGLAGDATWGRARQEVVAALWRFRTDPRVAPLLSLLINDPDVSLQAMSALRRTVGNEEALPLLEAVLEHHPDSHVRWQAGQAMKRATKAIAHQAG